ncbi:MAG: hypothetical protein FRX49_10690 [Trebouxia sp. A1-2]|nr:MAG: hypothetical protein FRX49_10690 [Trebouxia sp. A1-2]
METCSMKMYSMETLNMKTYSMEMYRREIYNMERHSMEMHSMEKHSMEIYSMKMAIQHGDKKRRGDDAAFWSNKGQLVRLPPAGVAAAPHQPVSYYRLLGLRQARDWAGVQSPPQELVKLATITYKLVQVYNLTSEIGPLTSGRKKRQRQSDRLPWQELWESRVYPSDDLVGPLIPDDTSMEDSAELAAGQNASRPSDASSIRLAVPNGEHDHVSASSRLCSFWVTGNNLLQSKGAYGA